MNKAQIPLPINGLIPVLNYQLSTINYQLSTAIIPIFKSIATKQMLYLFASTPGLRCVALRFSIFIWGLSMATHPTTTTVRDRTGSQKPGFYENPSL